MWLTGPQKISGHPGADTMNEDFVTNRHKNVTNIFEESIFYLLHDDYLYIILYHIYIYNYIYMWTNDAYPML